jgi:hypothetical protein
MKHDSLIVIQLLILLVVLTFIRNGIHLLFDENFLNLKNLSYFKKYLKYNYSILDGIYTIFAVVRLFIVFLIFTIRGFKNDILSYILIYNSVNYTLRIYTSEILKRYYPNSKQEYYLDKYLDFNSTINFITSFYIIYYILFS